MTQVLARMTWARAEQQVRRGWWSGEGEPRVGMLR